ncbi:SDR family oxidoreductase [Bosea sp. (in: a-proteobacteria)]|jgi:NAD(P)-dependent dehydrogenase (short-subunit alcohol dehydrogenase family)|uniref:SDR family NAD(P)-dependent oxidoreductase n=1 Tax=Bosea sp. (in: a-proteobacteria) TaxID=1871050 RepID=UPI00086D67C4|nr:SDR family oxidoreductase [Bosea sp. (in: a-proteobacteria)]MBN9438533.1 SDR family oxidoreductase [Bosea sp. (in: a-proteobacteria)]MBN9470787.1 SDR family oxidoreductase [Bosea sp. (in: a-proteobacteria)]ODT45830.1 MAG: 3-oxoacyl-ACP reductase [Methylobacterium sp. SCN 67-24]
MSRRLENKIALVFGAGSVGEGWGNGKASAVLYAREGAKVACVDLNLAAAERTKEIIESEGGTALALQADVVNLDRVREVVDTVKSTWGRIDVLHNNVGMNIEGGPVDMTEEQWDRVMDVNLKSMFFTCKCVLPIMEAQGSGSIVNISSLASIRWMHFNYISYYASKAAVNHFTRAIAMQYAEKGIRANTVLPGLMDTPHIYEAMKAHYTDFTEMQRKRAEVTPMKRMGEGWDIAYAALFLASDESKYITGIDLCVDGGLHCKTH